MAIFNDYRRDEDPLGGPAKQCTMLLMRTVCTLALHRRHERLLSSLGERPPPEWARARQQAEHEANGEVDLVLEEQVEADRAEGGSVDELFDKACSIQEELLQEVELAQALPEDEAREVQRNYALREQSVSLQSQIEAYTKHRTATLNSWREGTRVQENTAENDVKTLLRFLGWCQFTRHCEGTGLDFAIFMHEDSRQTMDEFVEWLQNDRSLKFSSIASYINSLMGCIQWAALELSKEEATLSILNGLYSACDTPKSLSLHPV